MLKAKYFSIALMVMLLGVLATNYSFLQKHKKARQLMVDGAMNLNSKLNYLERVMEYRMHFHESKFPEIQDISIIVYLSGKTCASCVEKLLHLINDKYNKKDSTLFFANYKSQHNFIISFNDAFVLDYEGLYDPTVFFEPSVDNILVFKLDKGKVRCILEYKPEEEAIFEEYFSKFDF